MPPKLGFSFSKKRTLSTGPLESYSIADFEVMEVLMEEEEVGVSQNLWATAKTCWPFLIIGATRLDLLICLQRNFFSLIGSE